MPENRVAAPEKPRGPLWARATSLFYSKSLDVRTRKDFVEAMQDFVELSPGEQNFHQTQLLFRQIQALEDLCGRLERIEALLGGLNLEHLGMLKELVPIRKSLKELVAGQDDLLDLLDEQQGDEEPSELEESLEEALEPRPEVEEPAPEATNQK